MDVINGVFELLASLFILNHCRVLYKVKCVAGVSILSVGFFFAWGIWNIFYYPAIGQTYSFLAGMLVCACNLLWVCMLLHYKNKNKNKVIE